MDLATDLAQALTGRYALERELGRGGMASVWLAWDARHGRRVAVKVLHPELAAGVGPERFVREVQVAAGLQHPHILPLFDSGATPASGESPGIFWYAMPYVEGDSLRQRMEREGQLGVGDALRIAREIAEALAHANSHGILHRDVKPENILLSPAHALLADFGIARLLAAAGESVLTATGIAVGTPAYMSPEQAVGARVVDARSDVYSLGCVLYEMLAGEPPHTGPTAQAIIAKRVLDPAPAVERCRPGLPLPVRRVVRRALAPVPADRYRDASEFARALQEAADAASALTLETAPSAGPLSGRRRSRTVLLAVGVLALGLAGTLGLREHLRPALAATAPADSLSTIAEAEAAYVRGRGYTQQVARLTAPPRLLDGAIGLFERAVELDTGFVVARVRLAEAHRLAGALAGDTARIGRAERMLDSMLLDRPDFPEALAAQGDFLQRRDRLDAAARSYERAASLRPGDASILGRLAFTQALRSDTAALATGARAVALAPNDPDLLRRVIAATSIFRRFDQLELYSDRLIALDPGDTFGYLHKALVQIVARGDTATALRTLAQAERVLGQTPMVVAWVYAMAGPAGWRRWHDLTLDQIASPGALDSLQYYWYQAQIAAAERRTAVGRAYADSVVGASAMATRQSPDYAYQLAIGAFGRALRGERAEGRRELAEAEALRRTMAPASQAMFQTAFIAANAELGDIDRAIAGTRWLLEEPALYTRRAVRLSPEFHRLLGRREFERLLADTSLP